MAKLLRHLAIAGIWLPLQLLATPIRIKTLHGDTLANLLQDLVTLRTDIQSVAATTGLNDNGVRQLIADTEAAIGVTGTGGTTAPPGELLARANGYLDFVLDITADLQRNTNTNITPQGPYYTPNQVMAPEDQMEYGNTVPALQLNYQPGHPPDEEEKTAYDGPPQRNVLLPIFEEQMEPDSPPPLHVRPQLWYGRPSYDDNPAGV
ncbi:hypothetical protein DRE_01585 [Drechslerella stenobrocha 248]|uniref:Uncharacterized protein n=1 Tax=Drechslerella stenobrocha 248 TaxID=1043628 RepID=W7HV21_9PEZI|nr:hypothetical protein DRE_01585 [Drechslerella stenobrocha 248]